ncbi:ABC transporter permease [Mycetocola tolaasinivorans]|uniref:Transport permease protein n=1 Tax=Mycetocola tolaasinivorans TaxID=76635 RepID=A0A3L7ABI4_9MICO|nr:ABC transporter permease [Mycetocola tolaasinivorans]RLP77769.1 ABC transporter permease [Mycetocola tolaasinivorans]
MSTILTLTRRNLRLFFRDRMRVFFSLLSALILVGLYVFFLGAQVTSAVTAQLPGAPAEDADRFIRAWVFAGVIMITSLTASLGAMAVFVDDRVAHRFDDFLVAPPRRGSLTVGYLLAAFIVAALLSLLLLVAAQAYLALTGGGMDAGEFVAAAGITVLCCLTFAALSAFVSTFIGSSGAFAALSTIVGTAVGFLAGAYVPMGTLPASVANVLNALPFAQAASLVRGPLTAASLDTLDAALPGSGASLGEYFGVSATVGNTELTTPLLLAILCGLGILFLLLAIARFGKRLRTA